MMALNNPMMKGAKDLVEKMKQVKGIPLAETTTVKVLTKTVTNGREATEVKKGPIAASAFALPTGYKKVESPLAKMAKSGQVTPRAPSSPRNGWPAIWGTTASASSTPAGTSIRPAAAATRTRRATSPAPSTSRSRATSPRPAAAAAGRSAAIPGRRPSRSSA